MRSFYCLFKCVAVLLILSSSVAASPDEMIGLIREIKSLNDKGEFEAAKKLAVTARQKFPSSSDVYYESARAELSEFVPQDNILRYTYSSDVAEKALVFINQSLAASDSRGRGHSLALHIHTQMGDVKKSENAIRRYEEVGGEDAWFNNNVGAYYLLTGEFDKAYKIFLQESRNRDKRIHMTAWVNLMMLRQADSQYDQSELVKRSGYTRIEVKDFASEIKRLSKDKPLVLYVSSDDPLCGYCVQGNKRLSAFNKYQDVNYAYLSIEPWYAQDQLKSLIVGVSGVPFTTVYYNGLLNQKNMGAFTAESQYHYLIEGARKSITAGNIDRFSDIKTWEDLNYRGFSWASAAETYLKFEKYKAFAFVADSKREGHSYGYSQGATSQREANEGALDLCKKNKKARKVEGKCVMIFEGNNMVYKGLSDETMRVLKKDFEGMRNMSGL